MEVNIPLRRDSANSQVDDLKVKVSRIEFDKIQLKLESPEREVWIDKSKLLRAIKCVSE
jgi:hypothetical protein